MTTRKPLSKPLLILCTMLFSPFSYADLAGNPAAGEQSAAACAGCHGGKGQSKNSQWPNLAAQQGAYLINQLNAFKTGDRANPMMQAMAANLTDADMANLAAYFSSLPAVTAGGDDTLAKAGQEKAAMCLGCHGQKGEGRGAVPRLAGQHPDYLANQLQNFKQGIRKSGPMQAVAGNLSDTDMKELAAFFAAM